MKKIKTKPFAIGYAATIPVYFFITVNQAGLTLALFIALLSFSFMLLTIAVLKRIGIMED